MIGAGTVKVLDSEATAGVLPIVALVDAVADAARALQRVQYLRRSARCSTCLEVATS